MLHNILKTKCFSTFYQSSNSCKSTNMANKLASNACYGHITYIFGQIFPCLSLYYALQTLDVASIYSRMLKWLTNTLMVVGINKGSC